ncbi:MAG TPA: glutathione S-transferase family protein [Steroidobacteraceae bacterium]|nr:glutathione S-transferase family protein [Steroidobacteraceae bacterium]
MSELAPLITYFDVRGRAEVIRLIFEETGTPYRERRIKLEDWPALKPTLPFAQLPTYEDGELSIVHSHAIYRHLARKHGLCGNSESERVRCDVVEETFVDAQSSIGGFFGIPSSRLNVTNTNATLPDLLGRLQRLLEQNDGGNSYWVGRQLTLADFVAWPALDYVRPFSQRTLERFDKLYAFKQRFEARPRIAAYLNSDRRQERRPWRWLPSAVRLKQVSILRA